MSAPCDFISAEPVLKRPHVTVEHWRFDAAGEPKSFDMVVGKDAAIVCGFTADNQVLVLHQFFVSQKSMHYSLVAGCVDPGDTSPEATVRRELMEEAGCTAAKIIPIGSVVQDKWQTGMNYCFLAIGVEQVATPTLDGGEYIEPQFISLDQFRTLVHTSQIHDAAVAVCAHQALHYIDSL